MQQALYSSIVFFLFFLCMQQALAQQPYLTLLDEINLKKIQGAEITWLDQEENVVSTSQTDQMGRAELPLSDAVVSVSIEHPEYDELKTDMESLKTQGYQLFMEPKLFNLDEVVFTANKFKAKKDKTPYQIQVVKSRDIEFQNPQTSADLLTQSGKVFVQKSQMGGGSPNLRGFEANKVLIVVDGVRLNNAIFRGGHLQNVITIDPNLVERTEVLFGPGSVIYGSDALGGVMHFYSRDPRLSTNEKASVHGNLFGRFSSANLERTGHYDMNIGLKKWGFLTSLSITGFDDLRAGSNYHPDYPDFGKRFQYVDRIDGQDSVVENENLNLQVPSGYTQYDFMQKVLFLQNERITHGLNFQFSTSTDVPRYDRLTEVRDGMLRRAEWYYGPQKRLLASYKLKVFGEETFYDELNFIAAFQDIEESRHTRSFGSDGRNNRMEHVQVLSLNLDASKSLSEKHELSYGAEAAINWVDSEAFEENIVSGEVSPLDTRYPDGGSNMRFLALYGAYLYKISKEWTLSAGARFTDVHLHSEFQDKSFFPFLPDDITQNSRAVSGNLGLVWLPEGGWRIALLAATGFRAPNVDDMGKVFDSSPGNVIVPNPDLKPEYTYTGELTLSKDFGKVVRIEATGFYTLFDNALVVRDFSVNGMDSILYEGVLSRVQANINAKEAVIAGFNANINVRIGKHITASNTLTYTRGRDISSDIPLDHIPPIFGRGAVNYETKKFQAEAYVMFNGWKRIEDYSPSGEDNQKFATEDGMPAWYTLNLKTAYAVNQNLQLQLGIENILDRHYRVFASGISAPGVNVIVTARASF